MKSFSQSLLPLHLIAIYHPPSVRPLPPRETRVRPHPLRQRGQTCRQRPRSSTDWLVGEKCTYADLAFVMWNAQLDYIMQGHGWNIADYPNFKRWQEAMLARDSLKKVMSWLMDEEVKSTGRG